MQKRIGAALTVALGLALAGCEGDDGRPGANGASGLDGTNGFNTLVATRELRPGDADCPGGGIAIDSGLDTNANNVLDIGEITNTFFVECGTAPRLRAFHASPDAPNVNVLVNGATALADVPYKTASGFLPAETSTQVQIEGIIPGGNSIVIDETLTLDFETDYTVVAIDEVGSIGPLVIDNPTIEPIPVGNFRAQVLHSAPNAPAVDVYVTTPGADLMASAAISPMPLAFRDFTGRLVVPAGDYQIRVTLAGQPDMVDFDSGTIALADNADLLIAAVDNTGPGESLVQLVVLDGTGSSVLLDAATPASVVAVHGSPDAGNVDLLADDTTTMADEGIVLAADVAFPDFCEIAVPAPGSYTINVTAAGDPTAVALSFPLAVEQGNEFTAIVTGLALSTPALQPIALVSDARSVITETKLRVVHSAPGTGDVDVYLLVDGTDFSDMDTMPSFAAVPFGSDTGILSIEPGVYDVYVTPAGDKGTVAIEVQDLPLSGGQVLDVIARDPKTDDSEGPLPQLIVIDYAALPAC